MNKKILTGVFFILCFLAVNAADPQLEITSPGWGSYYKQGDTINIQFTIQDANIDGADENWLRIELYYHCVGEARFEHFIANLNLNAGDYCGTDKDFRSPKNCTYAWNNQIAVIDDNCFIDANAYDSITPDKNRAAFSQTFYVDNNKPTIAIIYPTTPNTDNQRISFDVNDAGSMVSTILVKVDGSTSSYFDQASHCTGDKNYHCDYNENSINMNNSSYYVIITATDLVGNEDSTSFSVTYLDQTAPPTPNLISATPGAGVVSLEWEAISANDLNGYKAYYYDGNCDFNAETGVYAGFTTGTTLSVSDLNADKNYYFKVTSIDYSGNESNTSNCLKEKPNPAEPPNAPNLTSTTHTHNTWTSENHVIITWNDDPNATGYSCTWSIDNANDPDQIIDANDYCKNRNLDKDNVENGTHYLKVRACNGNNNCSGISTFIVKIDNITPSKPRNLNVNVQDNGDMKLEWDAPNTIGLSGISEYRVYRHTSSDFSINGRKIKTTDSRSYTDTYPSDYKGTRFYYKVVAVSNAGLESDPSDEESGKCEGNGNGITIDIDVLRYTKAGETTITVSSIGGKMYNAYLYLKHPNGFREKLKSGVNSSSFSTDYTFKEGDDGTYEVQVEAEDEDGVVYKPTAFVTVDTEKPSLEWLEPVIGQLLQGKETLKVSAKDAVSGIDNVSFYYDSVKIPTVKVKSAKDEYSVEWDTSKVKSGEYEIKAIATDQAGNSTEAILSVKVVNENELDKNKEKAQNAIDLAVNSKEKISSIENQLKEVLVSLPLEFTELQSSAEKLMAEANSLLKQGYFKEAQEKALLASKKFTQIANEFTFLDYNAIVKSFSESEIKEKLGVLNISPELSRKAIENLKGKNPVRKIKVVQVKDGNSPAYNIVVIISLKNDSNDENFQVVEIVPKSLAFKAERLQASQAFIVIKDDPIIKFNVSGIPKGETVEIKYNLKEAISKSKADAFLERIEKDFSVPPLYFSSKESITVEEFAGVKQSTPAVPLAEAILPLVLVLIVFVVIVAALFFFYYAKKPKKETAVTPLHVAVEKTQGALKQSRLGLFKRKQKPKTGRWAYKGE